MIIRPFKGIQAMGAASQAVFGTTISAVTSFATDPYTSLTTPGSNQSLFYCTLTSAVGFVKGDRVVVGPKTNFVFGGALDAGFLVAVNTSTGVVTIQGLQNPHVATEWVVLQEPAAQVIITPRVSTAVLYLGLYSSVAAADPSVFDAIPIFSGTGVPYWHSSISGDRFNPFDTSEYWINGTSGDTFFARFVEF